MSPASSLSTIFMISSFVSLLLVVRNRRTKTVKISEKTDSIGFIFDLDGTLLDFEGASHEALNFPLKSFGKTVDWKLHGSICGKRADSWSRDILTALNVTEMKPEAYVEKWHEHILTAFPRMKLMPGALEIVEKCQQYSPLLPLAIATSSERENFDAKMKYHPNLLKYFSVVVTGKEVARGKPNPDIFVEAARRIGIDPSNCVVFEDSPNGAEGGKRAGCFVIAIPDSRMQGNEDKFGCADLIFSSLEDVDIFKVAADLRQSRFKS